MISDCRGKISIGYGRESVTANSHQDLGDVDERAVNGQRYLANAA